MAEGFAVVAIISSIVQLVDFTSKVVARLNDFQSGTNEIPKSLGHLKAELPVLVHTLQQIHEAIKAEHFPKECATALLPAVQGCDRSIHDIESILAKTLPTQSDGRTKKVIKSVGSVWNDGKIEGIMTALRGYTGTLTFYFVASSSILQPLTDTKLVKIRQWLSAPDPSVNFEKALRLREAGTGLWLLESDLYKRWKAKASFVWLHGIPGCGKTVLSSTVLADVREYTMNDPGKAVAYFYFDFNDRKKQDPELMIRSLVSQLSQQCVRILPGLDVLFTSCESGQRQPSLDALLKVLQELVNDFPCTYLIIDALDECENHKELMSIIKKIFRWQAQGLHVLFTSRREGDIKIILDRILDDQDILCIQTNAVNHDIQKFVRQRLSDDENLQKWQGKDKIMIESALLVKACGMFRLTACQLDILGECRNRKQLLQALNNLPSDLDETYNRILSAIKKSDVQYAIRILRWLAFSQRPLLQAEVAEIVALDADRRPAFDRNEVLQDPSEVLSICSSLVTVIASDRANYDYSFGVPDGPLVFLAHYSVKEYLVSERILKSRAKLYGMEPELCHRIIAKSCIQYLLQFERQGALTEQNLDEFALAKYSAQEWVTHSKSVAERDADFVDMIVKLLKEEAYLTLICLHDPDGPSERTNFGRSLATIYPLYYASQAGLADVVRRLVSGIGAEVNAKSGFHGNALQAASFQGHLDVVQFLVEKGAEVNAKSENYYSNALQAASFQGHLDVVQFLVEKGAEIYAQSGLHGNALQAASSRGHLDVVEFLVEKGAEVNAQGGKYGNALRATSSRGYLDVVQFLVEKGAEVNAQGGEYGDALQAASSCGWLNVVEFLVEKGAEVNAQGGYYGNALQAASCGDYLDVVQFLVEKGAEVNAQGGKYGNALRAASSGGHLDVVEFLVEKGAEVNAQGGEYGNALQAASSQGCLDVVQFLVEKGAEVNAKGGRYGNALQAASSQGHLDVVQFLVEKGAEVNAQGGEYGNALQAASSCGWLNVVEFLVEKGAEVNAQGGEYGNALQAASSRGHLNVVQFLVEKGAEVNAQGGLYGNALQAATSHSRLDTVRFLVEKGAWKEGDAAPVDDSDTL